MSQVSDNEPSQNEPASGEPKAVGDDFAWLYRRDEYAPSQYAPGVAGGDPRTLLLPLELPPPSLPSVQPVPAPPSGRNPMIIMIVILLCLTVGAVTGIALLLHPDSRPAASGSAEPSGKKAAAPAPSSSGQVTSATPTQVKVGCQAPQTTDDAGNPVYYVPEQMFDGKMNTAWRCNGNGIGQVVTFEFPAGTSIAEVGLVNGYAKVDPASGAKRYGEYRRITKATWTFADGASFQQSLEDGVKTVQKLSIPSQSGDQVTLTIEASTGPGSNARGRDAVLISEIAFGSPA
jgi:hypothetical protein